MENSVINEMIARSFLLGQLSPEEQGQIEELAFDDPDTFTFIQAAQEDLIDDFVNDQLSLTEKESFQKYFLAQPGRRQDLRIGRALQRYLALTEQPVAAVGGDLIPARPQASIFAWIRLHPVTVPLVLLILVAAVVRVVVIPMQRDNNSSVAQIEPTPAVPTPSHSPSATPGPATPSPTPKQTQSTPTPSPRQSVEPFYALLAPGSPTRSEGDETKVPPVLTPVSFELPLVDATPYRSYQAVLQKNGKTIRTWSNLQPKQLQSGRAIKVEVPAGVLENLQHYRIILNGMSATRQAQPVHNYYFQVSN